MQSQQQLTFDSNADAKVRGEIIGILNRYYGQIFANELSSANNSIKMILSAYLDERLRYWTTNAKDAIFSFFSGEQFEKEDAKVFEDKIFLEKANKAFYSKEAKFAKSFLALCKLIDLINANKLQSAKDSAYNLKFNINKASKHSVSENLYNAATDIEDIVNHQYKKCNDWIDAKMGIFYNQMENASYFESVVNVTQQLSQRLKNLKVIKSNFDENCYTYFDYTKNRETREYLINKYHQRLKKSEEMYATNLVISAFPDQKQRKEFLLTELGKTVDKNFLKKMFLHNLFLFNEIVKQHELPQDIAKETKKLWKVVDHKFRIMK